MNATLLQALSIAALAALFAATMGALVYFDAQVYVLALFRWLEQLGIWGPILFVVINLLAVVLLLPGIVLTVGAGFLFGFLPGALYVIIGTTLGAAAAFLIARYLLGERASRLVRVNPRWRKLDEDLAHDDWKIVMLTRMVPLFPYKLSNYFFGLTRFRLKGFVIGTVLGIVPATLINAYIGSIAADLAMLGTQRFPQSPAHWALYLSGFVVGLAAFSYLAHRARRALQESLQETAVPGESAVDWE